MKCLIDINQLGIKDKSFFLVYNSKVSSNVIVTSSCGNSRITLTVPSTFHFQSDFLVPFIEPSVTASGNEFTQAPYSK